DMSADFPHDPDPRAGHEPGEAPSQGGTTPPPEEAPPTSGAAVEGSDVEVDAARANTLPDPGAALALEVVTGALGVETAEVLLAGPDGGLERLGSVVSPASDAEILEVLASLQ